MTPLRQRMQEDMQIRNLAASTQSTYIHEVAKFARHFGKSPEYLGPAEIREYQLHLLNARGLSPSSLTKVVAALRFLYQYTLAACGCAPGRPGEREQNDVTRGGILELSNRSLWVRVPPEQRPATSSEVTLALPG